MVEICWQEFTKSGYIVTKRREFKTEVTATAFIEKLYDKESLYRILATR